MNSLLRSILLIGVLFSVVLGLGGCSTVARSAMEQQNQDDLKNGRQSPTEYQQRRDEIDRKIK